MVLTIISFAVGVGNVEGFLISEIMPVYAKDTLSSIGQPLNWIANLTVSTLFPIVFEQVRNAPKRARQRSGASLAGGSGRVGGSPE